MLSSSKATQMVCCFHRSQHIIASILCALILSCCCQCCFFKWGRQSLQIVHCGWQELEVVFPEIRYYIVSCWDAFPSGWYCCQSLWKIRGEIWDVPIYFVQFSSFCFALCWEFWTVIHLIGTFILSLKKLRSPIEMSRTRVFSFPCVSKV